MFGRFITRLGFPLFAVMALAMLAGSPLSSPLAQSRDAVVECNGGLLVWSQPSGNRFLIFFKGTGKFRSLDVEANFGGRVLFGIQGRGRNQIHGDRKTGTVRCRYH
jgi:hypothetical protein